MCTNKTILLLLENDELKKSIELFLNSRLPEYRLQEVETFESIQNYLNQRRDELEDIVLLIEPQRCVGNRMNNHGIELMGKVRLELDYPLSGAPITLMSSESQEYLIEHLKDEYPILELSQYYVFFKKRDIASSMFNLFQTSKLLSESDVREIKNRYREKKRIDLSSDYRHAHIKSEMLAAARILQGAFLCGDVDKDTAIKVFRELAKDDETHQQKMEEYVALMDNKGYMQESRQPLSDIVKSKVLLIDDEYDKNGWDKVIGAIFPHNLHCVSNIEDGISYVKQQQEKDCRPFVLLDLVLRSEAELFNDEIIETAIKDGVIGAERLRDIDKLLPILVFTKHEKPRINRKTRDLNLKCYLKEVPEDRDEVKYYKKFRRLVKTIVDETDQSSELEAARKIQKVFLSRVPSLQPEYDIAAQNMMCKEVGGDFYYFKVLDDGQCCIAIGDVEGKGLPAAMLMATIQGGMQVSIINTTQPKRIAETMNILACENNKNTENKKLITFFAAILNLHARTLLYTNAGHIYPMIFSPDKDVQLEEGGTILGFIEDAQYNEEGIQLNKGDVVVFYTDGITDAGKNMPEQFGKERLKKVIQQHINKPAKEIIEEICNEVDRYTNNQQDDDITLVVLKVL